MPRGNRYRHSFLIGIPGALFSAAAAFAMAAAPAAPCKQAAHEIEQLVCQDAGLATLDRQMTAVYAAASKKADARSLKLLKAEQHGWLDGRNECWKADDKRACTQTEYQRRIAELQARYALVAQAGAAHFVCSAKPGDVVSARFFKTDPPTLIARYGDTESLMYAVPSGSGSKYQGRNESLWEHQGEVLVTWGYGAPEMRCKRQPA
ncbi:Lipoprotein LprI [Andreprevotia sp. IGB-42]|uniref:MliC family protein n=1 Tax=Andreprevotia sp. IGB-42 TaxID=2497473 RepID=UPI0013584B3A|nr:MliC family protein [Andreprevotia sp. IGB-42]KAF0811786.1 Lipoprotein LprI [Andreprevotia sp. IGB-42]